jgi:xylulokinase
LWWTIQTIIQKMPDRDLEILVLDVGTSALKATLYTQSGAILAQASQPYGYQCSEPGAAEADPDDWWQVLPTALRQLQFDLSNVRVIGLTGQMHSAVLLDEHRQPIKPCLLWLDRRCAAETAELMSELKLPPYHLNSTYTLPKLVWLSRHRPDVIARARTLLFPKDYVRFKLTGVLCTDHSEAGGAALFDWKQRTWTPRRLAYAHLSSDVLPPLHEAGEVVGTVLPNVADTLGLSREAQVVAGVGDVAAILGGAPVQPGRVMCTMGTSSMLYAILPDELRDVRDENDGIYPYDLCGFRLLGGVSSVTGGALDWAWRAFGAASGMPFTEAMKVVERMGSGADGLIFLPYLAGERSPFWRDDLRGMFIGLNLGHTWAHMLRAVVEGVGLCTRLMLDRFARLGLPSPTVALSGGASRHAIWRRVLADTCQRTIEAFGADSAASNVVYALCAQVLEPDTPFAEAMNRVFRAPMIVEPDSALDSIYHRAYEVYQRHVSCVLDV